jgi:hypothetical protein
VLALLLIAISARSSRVPAGLRVGWTQLEDKGDPKDDPKGDPKDDPEGDKPGDKKPSDNKPADKKPAENKPADKKPDKKNTIEPTGGEEAGLAKTWKAWKAAHKEEPVSIDFIKSKLVIGWRLFLNY